MPQRTLIAAATAALLTSIFAALVGLGLGGETFVLYLDDLGILLAAATATFLCARAAHRHAAGERRFWLLLAAACGAWALAEGTWAIYDLVLREEVPVPSWADVGYLAGIPLAVAALLSHPTVHDRRTRQARSLFDGLVVATSLLFLSWSLVLGPLWGVTDTSVLGGIVSLAYPFGDVVIIFFVLLIVRRSGAGDKPALWCLLAGLLSLALADSTYAYLVGVTAYEGGLIDAGWFAGYLGIGLAAFVADPARAAAPRAVNANPPLSSVIAPFLPVLLALGVLAVKVQLGHTPDQAELFMATALVVLVLARQALALKDLTESRAADLVTRPGGART